MSRDDEHRFSKPPRTSITLIEGLGVDGDAHAGTKVQHLSRVRANPDQPNLRQVHLVASELLAEVRDSSGSNPRGPAPDDHVKWAAAHITWHLCRAKW